MKMFGKTRSDDGRQVALWLLTHTDPEELQRLLLREDVPPAIWRMLEGYNGEMGLAEPVSGESPYNR